MTPRYRECMSRGGEAEIAFAAGGAVSVRFSVRPYRKGDG